MILFSYINAKHEDCDENNIPSHFHKCSSLRANKVKYGTVIYIAHLIWLLQICIHII